VYLEGRGKGCTMEEKRGGGRKTQRTEWLKASCGKTLASQVSAGGRGLNWGKLGLKYGGGEGGDNNRKRLKWAMMSDQR